MKENNFVFADLSTYELATAKQFYSAVFNWFYDSSSDYSMATHGGNEISGLYETPQKFKEMNMPSFWMSYIQVNSVERTVEQATELGGIIEVVDLNSPIGKIALIRDPAGAGFTIYEGDLLNSRYENSKNALVWNELHVSSVAKVAPFYEGIFNWSIKAAGNDTYNVLNGAGEKISTIRQIDNSIKGKYEYWGVFFAVENVQKTKNIVLQNGGSLIYEDENFTALADSFGAFFHIVPLKGDVESFKPSRRSSPDKWKAYIGLTLIFTSLFTGWYWLWSIFFAIWLIMDIKSKSTFMLEPVHKNENPVLYWIIVTVWGLLSVLSLIYYAFPELLLIY